MCRSHGRAIGCRSGNDPPLHHPQGSIHKGVCLKRPARRLVPYLVEWGGARPEINLLRHTQDSRQGQKPQDGFLQHDPVGAMAIRSGKTPHLRHCRNQYSTPHPFPGRSRRLKARNPAFANPQTPRKAEVRPLSTSFVAKCSMQQVPELSAPRMTHTFMDVFLYQLHHAQLLVVMPKIPFRG
jgi:hypothetical protein